MSTYLSSSFFLRGVVTIQDQGEHTRKGFSTVYLQTAGERVSYSRGSIPTLPHGDPNPGS